jgi:shikimate dehydrogenase
VHAVVAHRAQPQVEVVELAEATLLPGDVLVSTVPASAQTPEVLAAVADVPLVFEVIYEPWPSPLAAASQRRGRTVINGLDLLLAQAADQLRAMTGREDIPIEAMREAAERELAARSKL